MPLCNAPGRASYLALGRAALSRHAAPATAGLCIGGVSHPHELCLFQTKTPSHVSPPASGRLPALTSYVSCLNWMVKCSSPLSVTVEAKGMMTGCNAGVGVRLRWGLGAAQA